MHARNNANINAATAPSNSTAQPIVREQDRFMPIANVIRIMRRVLPPHAKISDDAKETIQECVSEYISFITSEANDNCRREQRKTITAEDVIRAMSKLGFDNYVDPLTHFLHRYRGTEGSNRSSMRGDPHLLRRSGSGAGLLPLQPTTMQMAMQPQPMCVLNAVLQQQQQGVMDGYAMGRYCYFDAYGDEHRGRNSGDFDPYADDK